MQAKMLLRKNHSQPFQQQTESYAVLNLCLDLLFLLNGWYHITLLLHLSLLLRRSLPLTEDKIFHHGLVHVMMVSGMSWLTSIKSTFNYCIHSCWMLKLLQSVEGIQKHLQWGQLRWDGLLDSFCTCLESLQGGVLNKRLSDGSSWCEGAMPLLWPILEVWVSDQRRTMTSAKHTHTRPPKLIAQVCGETTAAPPAPWIKARTFLRIICQQTNKELNLKSKWKPLILWINWCTDASHCFFVFYSSLLNICICILHCILVQYSNVQYSTA